MFSEISCINCENALLFSKTHEIFPSISQPHKAAFFSYDANSCVINYDTFNLTQEILHHFSLSITKTFSDADGSDASA